MGEFSLTHILLFGLIVMLFFGSSRIEGIGKSLGRAIRGFKDGMNEIEADVKPVNDSREALSSTEAQKATSQKQATKEPTRS